MIPEEKPPFLGKWRNVYLMLIGFLVLTVFFLDFVTRYFQ